MKWLLPLIVIFLTGPSQARADVLKTIGEDLASPVTTKAITPFLIGAGLSVTLFALKAEISNPFQKSITEHRPFDKLAGFGNWAGQVYPNLIYCGYGIVAGLLGHERGYLRAEEMALATAYSGGVTSLLKVTFREGRPNNPVDKKSMPSGHATTAFAFAGIVGAEHPWYFAVPAYTMAVIVGYARINDNKHFLHDVVAGGTIGLGYALGVYYKRLDRLPTAASSESGWPTFSLLPTESLDGAIVGAAKRF